MATTKNLACTKAKPVRRQKDGDGKVGSHGDQHLIVGAGTGAGANQIMYRSLAEFDMSAAQWSDVARVVKIELVLIVKSDSPNHYGSGKSPKIRIYRSQQDFSDGTGAENDFASNEYDWPGLGGTPVDFNVPRNTAGDGPQNGVTCNIDVTALAKPYVPKAVKFTDGTVGGGAVNHGFVIRTPDEAAVAQRCVFWSEDAGASGNRPVLRVTYDPTNRAPSAPTPIAPPTTGRVTFDDVFIGNHNDPDLDPMQARQIRVWKAGVSTGNPEWTLPDSLLDASADERAINEFSVPLSLARSKLSAEIPYEWEARTKDPSGLWSVWSARRALKITSSAPTVIATNLPSVATMDAVKVGGSYSDAHSEAISQIHVQMRPMAAHTDTDPAWADSAGMVWDTGNVIPTLDEVTGSVISRQYAGSPLTVQTYTFRVQAQNESGVWSPWSYDDFALTAAYDPGTPPADLTTQVARDTPTRVVLWGMGAGRGRGAYIGTVDDPINLGGSAYMNAGGEMYFSLPALHPYTPFIEPHQTHYAVEQYRGDRYVEKFAGIVTDFDADADRVVFYGTDYLGLLATALDERYNVKAPDAVAPAGSKYNAQTVDTIIKDQLTYYRGLPNSAVGFINVVGSEISALAERVTIYSTYAEALPFISGLIDSHKAGTGREARFYVKAVQVNKAITAISKANPTKITVAGHGYLTGQQVVISGSDSNPSVNGTWSVTVVDANTFTIPKNVATTAGKVGQVTTLYPERRWALGDNWGKDRPNIRLEYGGLLNDFRVVGFGDFGTRVLGVGSKTDEVKPLRATGTGQLAEATFGRVAKARYWQDIQDQNDLQRRVNEASAQLSKIGKRIALAIRADMLRPFDGWDIGDHILIDIERGAVDTPGYGSGGYWTIYGVEWHFYPDGHSDLTLTVLPKKSTTAIDPDLIPSAGGGVPLKWQVGYGVPSAYGTLPGPTPPPPAARGAGPSTTAAPILPPSDVTTIGKQWQDLNTGCVYELDDYVDGVTGDPSPTYGQYVEVYCPITVEDIPPGYEPDTTAPPIPVIKPPITSLIAQNEDGSSYTGIFVTVGYDATHPATGLDDLAEIVIQATKFQTNDTPPQDDWSRAQQRFTAVDDPTGATDIVVTHAPVTSATTYKVRAAAIDLSGNRSGWSDVVAAVTDADTEAPYQPDGVVIESGMSTFGLRWSPIPNDDFAYTEVQYRMAAYAGAPAIIADPDHVPPITAQPAIPSRLAGEWIDMRTATTVLVVTGLENGDARDPKALDVRLRSVDWSGNTKHDTGTLDPEGGPIYESVRVDNPASDEKGWVTKGEDDLPLTAKPSALPGNALIWTSAIIEDVFAGAINATWITSGALRIGNAPPVTDEDEAGPPRIEVYDADGNLVGRWGVEGIEVMDPANDQYKMVITDASLTIWSGIGTVDDLGHDASWEVVRLTPLGIDAASITFGSMRGGHNLVLNSSFEMGAFGVITNKTSAWDTNTDWNAAGSRQGTDTNITVGASALTMTVV